ncbi:MAG TPA: efflux RND transporter permease subunit [Caulobacteraceae bacterium]|jgi:HAE1 family hydrophobic/amphiphilic exporter-1|nr:efflux RND transporter permease subunit [Caulobacteraceae bacterium]
MRFPVSAWAIRNPIPVALVFIALTLAGLLAYARMPIKQFPNVEFPLVQVSVTQSGAAPSEMETQITRPVEDAIAGIANVRHISSDVTLGASSTMIEFELGVDLQKATDDVRTAVERTRAILPNSIDPPRVAQVDFTGQPILTFAVSSPTMSASELSWFVDNTASRALQASRGVAQVNRVGGIDREIVVALDPARMTARGVTAPQINDALRLFYVDNPGGRADIGGREQTVRVLGTTATVDSIRNLTIPTATGYVRLADVAEVGDGQGEIRGFARLDGRPAVAMSVSKTRAASEVDVEKAVKRTIAVLAAQHKDVSFTEVVSTVKETRESYDSTVHVLVEGMVLAALVVLVFLRNWRATLITALAMPLSLLPTFAVISLLGFSLNIITLLALTLVIGILVDDAIVEIENIEKRVEAGETPYRAALVGADSIGLAVVATTATIVVVFMPVSMMPGIVGQFFKEFGLTVSVAVLFSLLVARLLTPLLAAYFLKPARNPRPRPQINPHYKRLLDWAVGHKWLSALFGAAVFFFSIFLASLLPTGVQPPGDPGYVYLAIQGPPGATRADMERAVDQTTRMLREQPDTERVFAQIGAGSGAGPGGGGGADLRDGTLTVILKDDRKLNTESFKRSIRPLLRQIPDVRVNTQAGGFGGSDMEIVLASQDSAALDRAQADLLRQMTTLPQVTDVRPAPPPPGPELVVRPKPAEAARLSVSTQAMAQILRIATIGDIDANVAKFSEGERRIPIRVRLPESSRTDLTALGALEVPTAAGKTTPLASVADLTFQAGPGRIVRYDRERRASVQASLNGATFGEALAAANKLPVMQKLPAGVHVATQGDAENMAELFGGFAIAMLTGIGLIYGVLVLLFGSFFKPVTILSALPLSLMGAFLILLAFGFQLDLPVLIGMLMLLGLAAKNSILLVEFAIEAERRGAARRDALYEACRERARPIIMTTVAMAAGMLPTALGLGEGSSFRQPMAVAVIGGLISSTALSLVLVPVVYEFIDVFEIWITPKLGRVATPRTAGDDRPIEEAERAHPGEEHPRAAE